MALKKEEVKAIIKDYGKSEKDTGSVQVQVALLTEQINRLTIHLKKNGNDAANRRGLMKLVGERRGLLDYLANSDREAYIALINKLGIRK